MTPRTKYFCIKGYTSTIGSAVITIAAAFILSVGNVAAIESTAPELAAICNEFIISLSNNCIGHLDLSDKNIEASNHAFQYFTA